MPSPTPRRRWRSPKIDTPSSLSSRRAAPSPGIRYAAVHVRRTTTPRRTTPTRRGPGSRAGPERPAPVSMTALRRHHVMMAGLGSWTLPAQSRNCSAWGRPGPPVRLLLASVGAPSRRPAGTHGGPTRSVRHTAWRSWRSDGRAVGLSELFGDGNGVTGASVRAGQRPAAQAPGRVQPLPTRQDQIRGFRVRVTVGEQQTRDQRRTRTGNATQGTPRHARPCRCGSRPLRTRFAIVRGRWPRAR